jgi:RNA recognition motif-containing protein
MWDSKPVGDEAQTRLETKSSADRGPVASADLNSKVFHEAESEVKEEVVGDVKPKTTLFLRKLPTSITRSQLLEVFSLEGFAQHVKLIYVPRNLRDGCNVGYAFVDFDCAEIAELCLKKMDGFNRWDGPCKDAMCIEWSGLQGRDAYVERYRNCEIMHDGIGDEAKPAIFDNGVRMPFPSPTKKLKVRLRRKRGGQGSSSGEE